MPKQDDLKTNSQIALIFNQPQPAELFKKAVPAIHIAPKSGSISLQQRKMFSSLIKNAIRQESLDKGRTTFEITISSLSKDVDLNSNNTEYVKETINSLLSTVVNWNYLTQDKRGGVVWKASSLLAGAELERSLLRYTFSDQIRPELLNPEIYALIDMRITRQFRKAHSLALWENVVRYEAIGMSAKFPLSTLRELILGQETGAQAYQEYKRFKARVLVPCVAEVNNISDHTFELIEHKVGRSVVAIQFKVTRKPSEADPTISGDDALLLSDMLKLSVPRSEARRLLSQYGKEKVRAAVAFTSSRTAKKNVAALTNVAAYFRKALVHGYAESVEDTVEGSVESPKTGQTQEHVRSRYVASRVNEATSYFNELEVDDQTVLIRRYNDSVPAQLRVPTSKAPTKLVQTSFYQWLVLDTWGNPTADDLLEFLLQGPLQ